jgi:hypothetical protein
VWWKLETWASKPASSGKKRCTDARAHLIWSYDIKWAITRVQLCRVFRDRAWPISLSSSDGDEGSQDALLVATRADAYLAKEDMDQQLVPTIQKLMQGRTRDSVPELTSKTSSGSAPC